MVSAIKWTHYKKNHMVKLGKPMIIKANHMHNFENNILPIDLSEKYVLHWYWNNLKQYSGDFRSFGFHVDLKGRRASHNSFTWLIDIALKIVIIKLKNNAKHDWRKNIPRLKKHILVMLFNSKIECVPSFCDFWFSVYSIYEPAVYNKEIIRWIYTHIYKGI